MSPELPEIWRGGAASWECDEMGHMNVRFYVAKFMEGLAVLARLMGMGGAFAPSASSTLLVRDHHLRFHAEARAGAPLLMVGAVAAIGECEAELIQILLHAGDLRPAASALVRVSHVEPRSLRAFPWSGRVRSAAAALIAEIPEAARPRSIGREEPSGRASLAAADALGLVCIGRGAVRPDEVDVFGRMRAEGFIGRVSDGVPGLLADIRARVRAGAAGEVRRVGGAVLEYRLAYAGYPRAGDHLELRSGVKAIGEKTQTMAHWLLDPVTGAALGAAEAVAVNFDLDARKVVPIAPEVRAALEPRLVPGLGL